MAFVGQVTIGSLRLSAAEDWTFFEFENLILARTENRLGSLQISTAYRNDLPQCAAHSERENRLRKWLGTEIERCMSQVTGSTIFGTADLAAGNGRAWYMLDGGQLLLAVYQYREPQIVSDAAKDECNAAEAIVQSAHWIN